MQSNILKTLSTCHPCQRDPLKLPNFTTKRLAVVSGIAFGIIVVVFAAGLIIAGQVAQSTGLFGRLILAGTLGSTWGINFGFAMKKGERRANKYLLMSSFFGTLIVFALGYAGYAVFTGLLFDGVLMTIILVAAMIAFASMIHAEVLDTPEDKPLKDLMGMFSTKGSPAVLSGIAGSTVYGVGWGVGIGILVGLASFLLPGVWDNIKGRIPAMDAVDTG